ncbi:MAG: hypothetical protein RL026_1037 [Pseudomonadota bacterium]|jgi:mono/diheme cytochrome c family protein
MRVSVLAVLVGLAATPLAAQQAAVVTPDAVTVQAALRERGKAVFEHRCAMCHRERQTGTFTLARRLGPERALLESRDDLAGIYIRTVVRWGLVNMPRLSRVEIPDADLDAVIAYLVPSRPSTAPPAAAAP